MITATTNPPAAIPDIGLNGPLAQFSARSKAIAEVRQKYHGLPAKVDDKGGYELVRVAIGELRTMRTDVEKRRKELKADALAWGKLVDAEAAKLTTAIEEIEGPLKAAKQRVDDEKDRIKREKEEAERKRVEDEIRQKREAEEAKLKAQRDAEEARLKAERERLAAEKAKLDAARKEAEEAQRVEREKLEAQARANEAERKRLERAKLEVEMEEAAKKRAEQEKAARALLAEMQPDGEKLAAFGKRIRALAEDPPEVASKEAKAKLAAVVARLEGLAIGLEDWGA